MEAALDRLRHDPNGATPDAASPESDRARPAEEASAMRGAQSTPAQTREIGPRARLGMARAALSAGRVEEARQYLEEAQLQLVFRPVTPSGDDAPGTSRVAGDVASALSMLGAGNANGALQYVDRAMGEARPAGLPTQQGYGYGRPYGGAPVADAGR
jgi:hypothetical protein